MEDYIERQTQKWKRKTEKQIEKLKQQGKDYYDEKRLKEMAFHKQFPQFNIHYKSTIGKLYALIGHVRFDKGAT